MSAEHISKIIQTSFQEMETPFQALERRFPTLQNEFRNLCWMSETHFPDEFPIWAVVARYIEGLYDQERPAFGFTFGGPYNNRTNLMQDSTEHAEMVALRKMSDQLGYNGVNAQDPKHIPPGYMLHLL